MFSQKALISSSPLSFSSSCSSSIQRVMAGTSLRNVLMLTLLAAVSVAAIQSAQAQTETVLHSFTGGVDGSTPYAGLVRDIKGNLYGTTLAGGPSGVGTVFKITPAGTEKILHSFTGGADGGLPYCDLILDTLGNLYGATNRGGANNAGTVFKVTPTGKETVLHSFINTTRTGVGAGTGLVLDAKGNLYGTNITDGAAFRGTVFKITPAGKYVVLHTFNGLDGGLPNGNLIFDPAGNLYGTTGEGGPLSNGGTVFMLTPARRLKTLYNFNQGIEGINPVGGLVRDAKGNLFGVTFDGSSFGTRGGVFELTPAGNKIDLYSFTGGSDDQFPDAGLVMDALGNLYGTTLGGGGVRSGSVFEITAAGAQKTLYLFTGGVDGGIPSSRLVVDAKGNLYGTTRFGGAAGLGTVFKVR